MSWHARQQCPTLGILYAVYKAQTQGPVRLKGNQTCRPRCTVAAVPAAAAEPLSVYDFIPDEDGGTVIPNRSHETEGSEAAAFAAKAAR